MTRQVRFSLTLAAVLAGAGRAHADGAPLPDWAADRTKVADASSKVEARNLLKASVIYLPLLLVAMMLNATGRLLF